MLWTSIGLQFSYSSNVYLLAGVSLVKEKISLFVSKRAIRIDIVKFCSWQKEAY